MQALGTGTVCMRCQGIIGVTLDAKGRFDRNRAKEKKENFHGRIYKNMIRHWDGVKKDLSFLDEYPGEEGVIQKILDTLSDPVGTKYRFLVQVDDQDFVDAAQIKQAIESTGMYNVDMFQEYDDFVDEQNFTTASIVAIIRGRARGMRFEVLQSSNANDYTDQYWIRTWRG